MMITQENIPYTADEIKAMVKTIEELRKKYNDALERARALNDEKDVDIEAGTTICEYIFPELKEDNNERIRKGLIKAVSRIFEGHKLFDTDVTREEALAWLENQEENKPTDKIEPMFHEGEWITNGNYTWKIVEVKFLDYILQSQDGNIVDDNISYVDKQFNLWTIEDAKDGDVLYSLDSNQPFIYKERPQFSQARGYCCINKFGEFAVWNTSKCVICTDKYIPATKEQRELLFQKMKKAGYEWNSEKKELKKIEPKMLDVDEMIDWLDDNICNAYDYDGNEITTTLKSKFKQDFGL